MARSRRVARVLLTAHVALACTSTVLAHHSSAMYDNQHTVTIRGVVTEFRWTNPHVTMTIATDPRRELWVVEATSPGNLSRAGWTRTSMRVGDRVELVVAPLRDGGHGGYCRGVMLTASGSRLEC
jgi:Family of unknown function (DUF6152)